MLLLKGATPSAGAAATVQALSELLAQLADRISQQLAAGTPQAANTR
jgi:hypothetical protein